MPSLTITVSQENLDRIVAAFEERFEGPVTAETIRTYIISDLKQFVRGAEREKAVQAAMVGAGTDVEIT